MPRGIYERKFNFLIKEEDKFGRLTAIKFIKRDKKSQQYWLFKCNCGNEKVIGIDDIKKGNTKSCGCLHSIHGMTGTRIYISWKAMKARCLNKNNPAYKNYGGRGITICPEWLDFENFYKNMGVMPENKSLDRIKNDKGYYPENCKWSTKIEQANNRRDRIDSHFLTYKGKTLTVSQWARELNINKGTVFTRLNREWSIENILKI